MAARLVFLEACYTQKQFSIVAGPVDVWCFRLDALMMDSLLAVCAAAAAHT